MSPRPLCGHKQYARLIPDLESKDKSENKLESMKSEEIPDCGGQVALKGPYCCASCTSHNRM